MRRGKRFVSVVIFAGLACVVGATAWACTASNFGTPATPAPPPPNTASPGVVPPISPVTPGAGPTAPLTVETNTLPAQSVSTSGAPLKTTGREPNEAPAPARSVAGTGRSGASVTSGFTRRAAGETPGFSSGGGQPVFADSTPAKPGKAPARKKATAAAPSARTATGDLWTGFGQGGRASVLTAQASARSEGIGGTGVAALAALGLGLAGIAGTMGVVAVRSRRRSRSTGN